MLQRHGLDWDQNPNAPYVHEAGGVHELLESINATIKNHRAAAGFVIDADEEIESRWKSLTDRFAELELYLPESPPEGGFVGDGLFPEQKVGVWIMPDNRLDGSIETFLDFLVPDHAQKLYDFAGECTEKARTKGADCRSHLHEKSQLHTWLAWQSKPGMPYGQAITAEVFDHDSELSNRFVAWFEDLYQI